jgi:hypothetical protein
MASLLAVPADTTATSAACGGRVSNSSQRFVCGFSSMLRTVSNYVALSASNFGRWRSTSTLLDLGVDGGYGLHGAGGEVP